MYVKKIKTFECCCYEDLEKKVNEFLAKEIELGINVLDVTFKAFGEVGGLGISGIYYAFIYYSEYVPEKEKEE